MVAPQNQAAWLIKAGSPLEVKDAPLPSASAGEIVVKNAAVAINPVDHHVRDSGVFVKEFPTIIGCDVAGEVYEVGSGVTRFKRGDRVIGHSINLVTGRPADGAYQLYTVVPASKAAILPKHISYTDGVVVPFALEAALCALSVKEPGPCMPGVLTPALALPYPTLDTKPINKTIIVYGSSSSVGSMTTQIAAAAGIKVIAIAGAKNQDFSLSAGATSVFDHKDSGLVEKVVKAVQAAGGEFAGIFDAISAPDTYAADLDILKQLGGGHLACVHPPPTEDVPANVQTGMIFAISDIVAPVFENFITPALEGGKIKCLPPPIVIGKGLQHVNAALQKNKDGVSAAKVVVEL